MKTKNTIAKILLIFVVGSLVALPVISLASSRGTPYKTPSLWPTGFWGPIVWCTGNYIQGATQVAGPNGQPAACTNLCDLIGTFVNVIYLIMSIAIFIITPIGVIWGGVMIMFSGANPGTLETGKKILLGTIVGLAIVLLAYLIVNTALAVLNVTSVGGFNGNPGTCQVLQ
jgi:hypothetical protein